jgi:peptide/nickel transport system permease protein
VANRDLLVVQGVVMLLVIAALAINFVVDILYVLLDPRLRGS